MQPDANIEKCDQLVNTGKEFEYPFSLSLFGKRVGFDEPFPPKTAHLYLKIIIAFLEAVFLKGVSKNYLDDGIKSIALSLCPVSHPQGDFVWKTFQVFLLHTSLGVLNP